ncbi:MAG: amino acid adenylation domain-containing protein, partial [Chloroflexi bacterium]|nr:amino acid adenylation domain-containing protein [Chloroflexota bacterium]
LLNLPTDRPRPAVQSAQGTLTGFELDESLHQALTALAQRENVTLFMLMLAAFEVLLYRWSGQDDLVVGTTISGRNRSELSNVMGFFANNLALRTSLSGNPTFREVVQRVRTTALAAYSHQDVPFELLVEKLNPERDLSHAPLFQVAFTLQNELVPTREVAGVTMRSLLIDSGTTKFDLTLFIWEGANSLSGTLEYSSALFDAATIARLVAHFTKLLSAIAADPEQRVDQVSLLSAAERTTVLDLWNATATSYPNDQCLHQLVEAQAARTPDAIAVIAENATLSYAELNARANQLAHYLQTLGIAPEDRIGLCVEPAPEMIVGMLAILKAGGAYVPLDPNYPTERLQWMLGDIQARIVLTQERLLDRLPQEERTIVCLDRDWPQIAAQPETNPRLGVTADNLAYAIYTSGSTGQPKGVLLAHRGAVNNLQWRQHSWPLDESDRMLQSFAPSFDPSVWTIFWPLMAGAAVVLVSTAQRADSAALVRLMVEHNVTAMGLTPTMHLLTLDEPAFDRTKLRYVVSGGEVLTAELQRRFFARTNAILCNCYGPTEATIDTTFWVCPRADEPQAAPIGHPLPNVRVYILDAQLNPAPICVPGELYIGGVNLARGYQGRPAATAERFIPDPFNQNPGARRYKTGDRARYRADGAIEFLGRIDEQVKVRGFRIELEEIEALLRQHPGLREVAVTAQNQQLVAYIVGEQKNQGTKEQSTTDSPSPTAVGEGMSRRDRGEGLGSAELRRYLQRRLPEYMIPAVFVPLDALPLTPSGKIDRKALPAVDGARPTLEESYVAPRTPVEEVLARIWAEVLGLDRVGMDDNFFDLGGHSLQANLLLSRVRDAFQVSLPLQTMFESTTVAVLAERLVEHESQPGRTEKIARLIQRIKGSSREELQQTLEQRRQQAARADR